jgi:hypothetical protein
MSPDHAAGIELIDDLADIRPHGSFEDIIDRNRPGLDVELNLGIDAGVLDRSFKVHRLAAFQCLQVNFQQVFLQGQKAGQVIEWILEMAIDRRDIPAIDLRTQVNRFAGLAAD